MLYCSSSADQCSTRCPIQCSGTVRYSTVLFGVPEQICTGAMSHAIRLRGSGGRDIPPPLSYQYNSVLPRSPFTRGFWCTFDSQQHHLHPNSYTFTPFIVSIACAIPRGPACADSEHHVDCFGWTSRSSHLTNSLYTREW